MPKNASINGDGFRMYQWPGGDTPLHEKYNATEPTDVLSVTSIRTLVGEPFQLVNWKISNVVNLSMGVRKQTRIGPKGGVSSVYVKDGPFPGEFTTRMMETRGQQEKLADVRGWLREGADEPRDVAAVRGSVVHKMIEVNAAGLEMEEPGVRARFDQQWKQEKRKVKPTVTDEDVFFVTNAMKQYRDMRVNVPFVILAQEPQVWNLSAGYAGSADVLMWFLPEGTDDDERREWQMQADARVVTLDHVRAFGGRLALGDWKTSPTVYTNHVVQGTAYAIAEFVGTDGMIDERLTQLLNACLHGMIIKIRPDAWEVDFFDVRADVVAAFLGSVRFARFLALNKTPVELFTNSLSGQAPGTGESVTE